LHEKFNIITLKPGKCSSHTISNSMPKNVFLLVLSSSLSEQQIFELTTI
jgi:hypothetical protein